MMKFSNNGYIELAQYEGVSQTPYLDSVNVKTVSVGLTQSDIKTLNEWAWDKEITLDECFALYILKLQPYIDAVNNVLKVTVSQCQFDALVCVTYNIGIAGITNSTFMKLINNNALIDEITTAWKEWDRGGGRVIQGLINRREKEINLYVNGIYSNNGMIELIKVNTSSHREEQGIDINVIKYFSDL